MRARLVVAAVLAVAPAAHAEDPVAAAKAEAKAANDLAAARDYTAAAAKFRAAFRLDPRPQYLCNVGVAYQRAKELPHAQIYLGECLRKGQTLDAKFIEVVRKGLADVEAKLRAGDFAPIDIEVKPAGAAIAFSTFDADETFVGAQVVWLPFGTHTISASAEGYASDRHTVEVTGKSQQHVRFELSRTHEQAPETPAPATGNATPKPEPHEPVRVQTRPSRVPPLVATLVTVAVGGGAVFAFVHAHSIMDTAGSSTIDRAEYDRRIDHARTWQHTSWALAGAAGIGAVLSTFLWVRASHETTVEVAPQPGGGTLSLSRTW